MKLQEDVQDPGYLFYSILSRELTLETSCFHFRIYWVYIIGYSVFDSERFARDLSLDLIKLILDRIRSLSLLLGKSRCFIPLASLSTLEIYIDN